MTETTKVKTKTEQFLEKYKETISSDGQALVHEFFIAFARFEFALKASIIYANERRGKVEPNWDKFIADKKESFNKDKTNELKNAVDFLLTEPPKNQHLAEGCLKWKDREFDNALEINKLSQHIRDVRNNLFHGGKFSGVVEKDVSRNYKLIEAAMIVLNEFIVLDNCIESLFLSDIQR